ncbi:hypothetical protein ACJJTC_000435 [Scirpophaga incertulas]
MLPSQAVLMHSEYLTTMFSISLGVFTRSTAAGSRPAPSRRFRRHSSKTHQFAFFVKYLLVDGFGTEVTVCRVGDDVAAAAPMVATVYAGGPLVAKSGWTVQPRCAFPQ